MIWRNIKYYRVIAGKSRTRLSQELGISIKRLDKYESGKELPNLEMARRIASVLGVKLADIMLAKSTGHKYEHFEYRKNSSFRKNEQEYIEVSIEDYLDRFFAVVETLDGKVLCEKPAIHTLKPSFDAEQDALALRRELGFALSGAIPNLIMSLENKGILIIQLECADGNFSGRNGLADGRPYIVVNSLATAERQRSTIAHELVHIYFERPVIENKDWERYMTAVSGAFLFPVENARNELGEKRTGISADMLMVCQEYGISLQMLAKRAELAGIISKTVYKNFCIKLSMTGQKKNEPSHIEIEKSLLFEQLMLRAIGENKITVQRGAELLRIPYMDMNKKMLVSEIYLPHGINK